MIALGAMLIACTTAPRAASETPTASAVARFPPRDPTDTPTPRPASTPLPVLTPRPDGGCPGLGAPTILLTVTPSAPRGGETVTVTAAGLTPGRHYSILVGSLLGIADAGKGGDADQSGRLTSTFVMPRMGDPKCLSISFYSVGSSGSERISYDYVYPGEVSFPSDRCETLPEAGLPSWEAPPPFAFSVTPMSPAIGDRVVVRGSFPASPRGWGPDDAPASASRYFGSRDDRLALNGTLDITPTGALTYSFTLPAHPSWSGHCVEVVVRALSFSAEAGFLGTARFNYP